MLSPSEILDRQFKSGLGYDKKDVESFLQEISNDYALLLQDNEELKKKLKDANEGLAYYKSIEKTLQKALVLAEKTAQDTKNTALKEAEVLEREAKNKAAQILSDAYKQITSYEHRMLNLIQQYDFYKIQFENLLKSQQELLNSKSFAINTDDFMLKETVGCEMNQEDHEDIYKNLAAITEEPVDTAAQSYQTDDGFEFFNMKDE